jgi:hypothetical protein
MSKKVIPILWDHLRCHFTGENAEKTMVKNGSPSPFLLLFELSMMPTVKSSFPNGVLKKHLVGVAMPYS